MWQVPPLSSLQTTLADPSTPIGMRMRATYFLRQAYDNYIRNADTTNDDNNDDSGKDANVTSDDDDVSFAVIDTLSKSLKDIRHGALLRHEFAYVMGQLRDERSIPALEQTLLDDTDDTMVRHECAEALGAIGSSVSLPTLQKCGQEDSSVEVGETCRLALDFIQWKLRGGVEGEKDAPIACACMLSPYSSVDPAPPHPEHEALSTVEIGAILNNENNSNVPLFERFRAMFSLRNRGGADAVKELGNALISDESSALLRHEVAYVLGQMQHSDAVEYLETSLKRENEHRMVRHESAEALGAIEERWGECEAILEQFLDDEDDVVRESCMVALDAADYWGYGGQQQQQQTSEEYGDEVGGEIEGGVQSPLANFSLQKAESNGKSYGEFQPGNTQQGVLYNHFNIA